MNRKSNMRRYQLHFILAFIVLLALACIYLAFGYLPARASLLYGPPAASLSISDRIEYSARLLSYGEVLTAPYIPNAPEQRFRIEPGESVYSIATRLYDAGIVSNSQAFFDYVVYTGLDMTIQAGKYTLSPSLSIVDIAKALQKFSPSDATLVILSGWRMEEIAASLPTSGLSIDPQAFISAAQTRPAVLDFLPPSASMEGFFYPDTYTLPRETTAEQVLDIIARNFVQHLTEDLKNGFASQGLDIQQAVTVASIVEREAIRPEEAPLIASVYLNRLAIGMKLDADPTVQYAVGFNPAQNTWWTNPLSTPDLDLDSPFNTYNYSGLPPAPISNPSYESMYAVAYPASTPYYYFRAKCDNSGFHLFAATLEEQIANGCE
ncbi:MAG: endolytic transglycosylase MltG [Anaerolineales bacterium]|nr:endolytic transglycosylase MltG [Anaerolineales bacterium]